MKKILLSLAVLLTFFTCTNAFAEVNLAERFYLMSGDIEAWQGDMNSIKVELNKGTVIRLNHFMRRNKGYQVNLFFEGVLVSTPKIAAETVGNTLTFADLPAPSMEHLLKNLPRGKKVAAES